MYRLGVTTVGQTLNADSANLLILVMYAFNCKNFQVTGTPVLFKDDNMRWDITAKAEGDHTPTKAEFRQMLQALLVDRFQLKAHREMREMQVYALLVGKTGPKFKEAAPDADSMGHYSRKGRDNVITLPKANMGDVVDAVANAMLDYPVVDQTGLSGAYTVNLTYTPNTRANLEQPDANDISVFKAVQDQLGLHLEPRKAKVEVVVVDSVEKPSAN